MTFEQHKESARRYFVYHNLTTLCASLLFAYALVQSDLVHRLFVRIGEFGYLGAFLVGMFTPSSFTVAPATVVLFMMKENLALLPLTLCAGLGSTVGDYLIFRFVRDGLAEELGHLFSGFSGSRVFRIFHSRYFGMLTPFIGGLIIMSPLPDELGVGLLGVGHMKRRTFLMLSFTLNVIGIFLLLEVLSLIF